MASSGHGVLWEWPFCVLYLLHFCTFLLNPHLDLEPDYIVRKQMKHRFQWYIVRTEILSIKSPLVTMGRPKFILKTAPSLRRSPSPSNTPIPRSTPHQPKQHQDTISRFATIHFADRQTDRQTDGPGECSMVTILRDNDALIMSC